MNATIQPNTGYAANGQYFPRPAVQPNRGATSAPAHSSVSAPTNTAFQPFGVVNGLINRSQTVDVKDTLLDPKENMSSTKALILFTVGIVMAIGARFTWRALFARGKATAKEKATAFKRGDILGKDPHREDEINFSQNYNSLSALIRVALADPTQTKVLLPYIGSGVLGYLGGSIAQGTQEIWVRREETEIRARLIHSLTRSFQKSIRVKQDYDNHLRAWARDEIIRKLKNNGYENPAEMVSFAPPVKDSDAWSNFFYQPTHLTVPTFGNLTATMGEVNTLQKNTSDNTGGSTTSNTAEKALNALDPFLSKRTVSTALVTAGALTGFLVSGIYQVFSNKVAQAFEGKKSVHEFIYLQDRETWWLNAIKNKRNLFILFGIMGLAAGAKLGKMFVDGLRQIEVTRVNARTELDYQTHNWVTLDTLFHAISEKESLDNQLMLLDLALKYNSPDRESLKKRINTVMINIGRNSAPKYFSMTPAVGLVDARF